MEVITHQLIDAAHKAGACSVEYEPGTPVEDVRFSDLAWAEAAMPEQSRILSLAMFAEARGAVPLRLFADSGYGDGSGYGYGDGDGYGYGDGDGYGYGYGDGDGYGDGYGYGSGSGYGDDSEAA